MRFYSERDEFVNGECENCQKVLKIKREMVVEKNGIISLNPPSGIRCFCGTLHHNMSKSPQNQTGMVCPHCQQRGTVETKSIKRKKGISGTKATGAIFTGGLSLLATGLSRKEKETEAHCKACGATWHYS